MRARTVMLLSALATTGIVCGAVVARAPGHHVVRRDAWAVAREARPGARAAAVLRAWDRHRAAAWASDDASALRALYVAGSRTGRRDVAMLQAYHRRGLQVTTMRRQLLAVQVRASGPGILSLVVTDRLDEARVTGAGARAALPRGTATRRRIVLRHLPRGWRVDEVYDA